MLEILIVIGLTAIIGGIISLSLVGTKTAKELDLTAKQIIATLREAQNLSINQASGTSWGVHFENSTYTPFYGMFYSMTYSTDTRVSYYRLPSAIRYNASSMPIGAATDVVFSQLTGLPPTSTSISILSSAATSSAGKSAIINISVNGLISY